MEILIVGIFALFLVGVYGLITKKHLLKLLIAIIITIESSQLMLITIGYLTNSTLLQEMIIVSMVVSGCTLGIFVSLIYKMLQNKISIKLNKGWWE
jgi:multisubunit Na+/H+ antiporter MnhC subunit